MRVRGLLLCGAIALLPFRATAAEERGEIREDGDAWIEVIDQAIDVGRGGTLTLDASSGGISVESWDKDGVRIRIEKGAQVYTEEEARRLLEACAIEVERQGDDVEVTVKRPRRGARSLSVEIDVTVPRPYSVDVKTAGGGIDVGDLEGSVTAETGGGGIDIGKIRNGSVSARTRGGGVTIDSIENGNGHATTRGGGIDVQRVTGDLVVKTGGGSIDIGDVGGHLTANTGGGGISIESGGQAVVVETGGGGIDIGTVTGPLKAHTGGGGIDIKSAGETTYAETGGGGVTVDGSRGPVKVQTGGGGITVENARGSIEAETGGGGITAELVIDDPEVDTHIDLDSGGGNLTLALPANLQATIDAELRLQHPNRRYEIHSDFDLEIGGDSDRRLTAKGAINGGGDLIRLRTTNGDITIERR